MVSDDSPEKKKPCRKRRARKVCPETICYVVEIKDWDWNFTFGVNTMKGRDDPYFEFRHLELRGVLLRPSKIKAEEVEVTFLPERRLNESERTHDQPQSVGSFQLHRGRLQFIIPMPADALSCVLPMMIAGRIRFVVMDGDRPRYGQGRIRMYRLVRNYEPEDMAPDA
ncbi:MAG TPA: hypothetical protein VG291_14270 [Xanthobacteraceae bacterium]|jgi:hypothetical protein|nr:hypothetical protein [Xanthobacteraceae bacterium]